MFFDLILLNRQHRARFGLSWLAATRGIKYLTKKNVLEVDLVKLGDDIMEFLCSDSDNPNARFSLRLSSLLVNGTLKIYRQKVVLFIDEVVKVLSTVEPRVLPPVEVTTALAGFPKQPTPIPRQKGTKRRRSEESTPQSEIDKTVAELLADVKIPLPDIGQELSVVQARLDEITLRETHIPPPSQEMTLGEDFGPLGPPPPEESNFFEPAFRLHFLVKKGYKFVK
nr:PREDICTED: meiotic recombination protein REC8 homolog [Tribolium castaneum]|eukprot:XP_015839623.1 PREDICTED: meiotic recombination protein REC8 homolog [Tribolium castaneum]